VKTWPAIVAVPVRVLPVLFVVALSVTVPLPVFDWPAVTLIHGSLLAAVQLQPVAVKTRTFEFAAAALVVTLSGDSVRARAVLRNLEEPAAVETVPVRTNAGVRLNGGLSCPDRPVPPDDGNPRLGGACVSYTRPDRHIHGISAAGCPTDVLLGLKVARQERLFCSRQTSSSNGHRTGLTAVPVPAAIV
jgi:hypothetical protein